MYYKVWIYLILGLLTTFTSSKALGENFWPPEPNFKVKVDYVDWIRSKLEFDANDNAWKDYKILFDNTEGSFLWPQAKEGLMKRIETFLNQPKPWNDSQIPELTRYIESLNLYISAYKRGTEHEYFAPKIYADGPTVLDVLLPYLTASQHFTNMYIISAWNKENDFEYKEFVTKLNTALKHTYHIQQGPSLVEKRTALEEKEIVYESILLALQENCLESKNIQHLNQLLPFVRNDEFCYSFKKSVPFESASSYSLLQDITYSKGKKVRFNSKRVLHWLELFGHNPGNQSPIKKIISEEPKKISELINSYYKEVWEILKSGCESKKADDLRTLYENYKGEQTYFKFFPLTSYSCAYNELIRTERKRRITFLAISLAKYRCREKMLPKSLDELINDHQLIMDPVTNKSYEYHKKDSFVIVEAKKLKNFECQKVQLNFK